MEETKMTRDVAMARFMASKRKRKEYVKQLEQKMRAEYERRTGQQANYFEVL